MRVTEEMEAMVRLVSTMPVHIIIAVRVEQAELVVGELAPQ